MALYDVFHKAANTVFKVFKSLIHEVTYNSIADDGWGNETTVSKKVDMIVDSFTLEDIQTLPFGPDIQPTDVKGLIRGAQLLSLTIRTSDTVVKADGKKYDVVNFTTDPASALYIFLLRD